MRKSFVILLAGIFILGCGLFGPKENNRLEYISTTDSAIPNEETRIELEDGAGIVIPANSIDSEVSVKVERNPEKANNLPPIDEGVVKVGDFYSFEIDGTINGPVDLILPFNAELIPENEAGVLVAAIPTENGWKYIPVVPNGNKVTLYTDQIGDPIIAWHFACIDRTDLSYAGNPDKACEEENAKKLVCDPDIALDVTQSGEQFEVVGSVIPVAKNFFGATVSEPAANIPVEIKLNAGWRGSGQSYSVTTGDDGSFSFSIDQSKGLVEGWNWVFASAECDPWWGNLVVESNGYAEFKYTPPIVEQPASTEPQPTETPAPTEQPIPVSAVLLPDFVEQPIDNAIDWLEANGFKYTWIDGSSPYDLGIVYKQAPAGGQYKVPHRTVVVLYRTTEQGEDVYGCTNPTLTPEEKANCGVHEYSIGELVSGGNETLTCQHYGNRQQEVEILFSDDTVSVSGSPQNPFYKIGINTYQTGKDLLQTITFSQNGLYIVIQYNFEGSSGCKWSNTYTRNK